MSKLVKDYIEICERGEYPPIAWSLEIAKRLSAANAKIAELEQELHTATERASKAEHRACVLDHPKGHYDTRDEIEMFLRDAYASGCNAAWSHSLLTAMEYAKREAPKLRELLRAAANARIAELEKENERLRVDARQRPRIVCLCGSSKFVAEMACIAWALERDEGCIVLGLHLLPQNYPGVTPDHMAETEGKKEHFDSLHKRKIELAHEILVINIGGYIGESTRSEIQHAKAHGKPVRYIVPIDPARKEGK